MEAESHEKTKQQKKRKYRLRIVLSLFAAILILISAICLRESRYFGSGESHMMEAFRGLNQVGIVASVEDTQNLRRRQQMLEEIQQTNADAAGWLVLPETVIDYPVMYSQDADYYVYHSYDRNEDVYGTPFLDSRNAADFSDYFSVIYAHDMNNGTMFGGLEDFQQTEAFQQVQEGILLLPDADETYHLTVIASFAVDTKVQVLTERLISEDGDGLPLVEQLLSLATQKRQVELTESDRFVALSALEYGSDAASDSDAAMLLAKLELAEEEN